jgi:glycosyltransferase involved in cell wall biosynthesis
MKLIIQIPCYNEEKTLPITLQELPRQVEGFDKVEWLVINDGSTDRTVEVAKEHGVDHIVNLNQNKGLAEVFRRGLDAGIKLGADVIVNTDADNQYNAQDIPKLVTPILEGKAEIVVGARPITEIPHFSLIKKLFQKLGSWVVRRLSYADIPDAPSGFRAISREAAMKLNVFNSYTYTLETIIQAGNKNIAITSIPIRVNEELRPSRLVKSISSYITNSIITLVRIFIIYRPFKTFMSLGILLFFVGLLLGLRFLYFYFTGGGVGHVQSVILAGVLLGFGFQTMLVAFLADLLAANRMLIEDVQNRVKKIEANEKIK